MTSLAVLLLLAQSPTWREAGPLIDRYCNDCHRPGQVGPFDFTTYDEASAYAPEMIRYLTENKMPPWHAAPGPWRFANSRQIPRPALNTILAWARANAPSGPYTPSARHPQWTLGPPDLVLSQPAEHTVSGEKTVEIVSFSIDAATLGTTTSSRYVRAWDFRPSNRTLLHHALLRQNGRPLAAWAMGDTGLSLPPGVAFRLEKGQPLTVELHYFKRTLRPARDLTRLALYFAPRPPARVAYLLEANKPSLRIPANAPAHRETSTFILPASVHLHAILPVFQLLATEVRLGLPRQSPPGLHIQPYEHHVMLSYVLAQPVSLAQGDVLIVGATYNNTTANEFNPHRVPRDVVFAENGLDETFRFWLTVSEPLKSRP
ncbi:MAG: hypothetical protein NW208_17785 [Bryobacter sp.]|nr:hypothetical protein [Bryobacter sp.]